MEYNETATPHSFVATNSKELFKFMPKAKRIKQNKKQSIILQRHVIPIQADEINLYFAF